MFHYLVRDGVTHLCMTEASAGKRLPFDFLEEVANRFARTFSEDARRNAIAFELNGEFESDELKVDNAFDWCTWDTESTPKVPPDFQGCRARW